MAAIGKIDCFDETIEQWPVYVERLRMYFVVNDVPEEKHVPALLSLIGAKTYGLLRTLTAPENPATKTFEELTLRALNY